MKSKKIIVYSFALGSFLSALMGSQVTQAKENDLETNGHVEVKASDTTPPLDPEDPLNPVNPGDSPSTEGDLRIDFVSAINFGDVKITKNNRNYTSLAQLFHSETPARAQYVQITDLREGQPGWNLQLKQETQFKNKDNIELNGATLSFDKGWANSGGTGKAPVMFRDTIAIDQIGTAYQVASASEGAGNGTWLLSFGASETNEFGQDNTLKLLKDDKGNSVKDTTFGKEAYTNSAINLSVPDITNIIPGEYQTELTWMLQATP